MKRFSLLILLAAAILSACGPVATPAPLPTAVIPTSTTIPTATSIPPTAAPEPRTLTVFAAASLTDAFTEIGHNFEAANPRVTVVLNFAGSQPSAPRSPRGGGRRFRLRQSHGNGQAGQRWVGRAGCAEGFPDQQAGRYSPGRQSGQYPNPAGSGPSRSETCFGCRYGPGRKIRPANSRQSSSDATYGADFQTRVLANLVSNENDVKLVVAKVQLGEADAGIVYISDSVAAPQLLTIEIPTNFNVVAKYPIAALVNAPQPDLAAGFITYVLSPGGQALLKKWGFTPVAP